MSQFKKPFLYDHQKNHSLTWKTTHCLVEISQEIHSANLDPRSPSYKTLAPGL
jgi:hypothetical protein